MVRAKLHGPLLLALALNACAAPDASRLDNERNAAHGRDAGSKGHDPKPSDAGLADTGVPSDAGPAPDGGECAAPVEFPQCSRPNALTVCADQRCIVARCEGEFVDCDGDADNGCEATLESLDNCGLCRAECRFPNAVANCDDAVCKLAGCANSFGNCDNDDENGCETPTSTAERCGDCNTTCTAPPNGRAACNAGTCGLGDCNAGFGDCNQSAADGCEQALNTAVHCGACARPCDPPNGTGTCSSGLCRITACDSGFVDCNGLAEDGCETPDSAAQNCCDLGTADCDKNASNGCEASFDQARTCGRCDNDCLALPHVQGASCNAGSCEQLQCDPGWADCDGLPSNGCERSTRTLTDCGACNAACAPAHASATCTTGTCTITSCDNGYANCNGSTGDGCEASLSQPQTCGSCTTACPGSSACVNGNCRCTTNSDCSGGRSCCDGVCQDTRGSCFPWPCIPGTATGKHNHCGGCDVACGLWCCL